ncbi:Nuclear ribonuclease Z [Ananas comosus]|uniref:Nuclear ribonuclease Z n=1 Tax=Ananas comosus TaxID=4615 RepID=A0A199VJE9_ANACO|nr:Nuclear ribonuclease Z [Ananas comosus]
MSRSTMEEGSGEVGSGSSSSKAKSALHIEGYPIEGLSIGGQETCVIFPTLKCAFDIGRCPQRAIAQDFGGLPMYVATRGLYSMKPPTIFVPASLKENVERLFDVHRAMDQSELKHNLIGLNIGEEFQIRKDLKVKAFKTYHAIPKRESMRDKHICMQGYIIYTVKQKLKQEFAGLSGNEIKNLRLSGVEITNTVTVPEIAFTGDTMSDFIVDPDNADVLKARILVMESTFVDDGIPIEHARDFGHTHLFEIASYADKFQNKAILLIHFSARYRPEEIEAAIAKLLPSFSSRVFALLQGF